MKDWTAIRERYMRDPLPVRLDGLAANLRRIKSFPENENCRETVASLINESKMFIEWTAAQAEINTASVMVEVQIQLALWQIRWDKIWPDSTERRHIAENLEYGQSRFWNCLGC